MMYVQDPEEITEEQPATTHFIDQTLYQERGRSFRVMVEGRMCPSCQARLGTEVDERVTTVDDRGKVVQEVRRVPFPANLIAQIRDCCSKAKGYIRPNIPLMEVIFRILLANGNQPLGVEEIYQQLDWMGYGERSRFVSLETLRRLLNHDDYYGFQVLHKTEEGPSGPTIPSQ